MRWHLYRVVQGCLWDSRRRNVLRFVELFKLSVNLIDNLSGPVVPTFAAPSFGQSEKREKKWKEKKERTTTLPKMNLQKISEFFPWDGESKLESHCILCLDQSALVNTSHSGEFLFTTLLLKLLQNAHLAKSSTEGVTSSSGKQHGSVGSLTKVVLVLTNHNRQHYEAIIKKNVS